MRALMMVTQLITSSSAFSIASVGRPIHGNQHPSRAQYPQLSFQPRNRRHSTALLTPVPLQTKAKPLLIPALGYAGLAGVAVGAQHLVTANYGPVTILNVPLTVAAVVAPALFLLFEFLLLGGGERVAKMMDGRPADEALTALCTQVAERAGLPPPAHVYEIPTSELNAFAAGFGRGDATVAVTSGMRGALTTSELEAVIAHELGHIRHSDMWTNMHVAVAIAGLGGLYEMGRILLDSSSRRSGSDKDEEGGAAGLGLMLMMGGAAMRVLAHLLQLSMSRGAEYQADRVAAELCGADAMIAALEKIDRRAAAGTPRDRLGARGEAFAHAYISNGPTGVRKDQEAEGLSGLWQKASRLLSTHPATDDRIAALRRVDARD